MVNPKNIKNTTTSYPKKINCNKPIKRRSEKYNDEEIDEIKEKGNTVEIPIITYKNAKKQKEEIEKNKVEEKKEIKKEEKTKLKPETIKKDKTIKHNHVISHERSTNNTKNKYGENMPKKRSKRKLKLDPNSLIFFGIILFVAILIFLKTMGALVTIATVVGIFIIIGCSIILKKIRRYKAIRIILNLLTIIFLLCCIAAVCGVTYFAYTIVTEAPEWDTSKLNSKETSILYSADNQVIAELGTEKRELITYEESSENLINAIIAVEDSRFFQHNGFDALRFFKASVGQVLGNSDAGGASTLSMQVVKNRFTDANQASLNSDGIKRKFTDIYLAVFKLEKEYSKEAIIEFYINNHFLGSNAYGVEQASQTYFGKHASELNLSEASLIAGMFQAPTSYNPFVNPKAATDRRNQVLNLMHTHGYITKEEMDIAKAIPVESLLVENKAQAQQYQSYIDIVVDELQKKWGLSPYNTSLKIYTNMNIKKQQDLEDIFNGKTFKWENDVVQSGIAAVDVWTGKIIAISGGRNYEPTGWHRSVDLNKQIGSTAKPIFDYAPAMEYSGYSTYTLIKDEKYYYSNSNKEIRNSDRKHMGTITLRTALAQSRNVPALKAFQAVDNEDIYNFVTSLGITPETSNNSTYLHEAHSIGAFNGSNPLEMAAAYAAFANGGIYYEPYTISKIVYRDTGETHEAEIGEGNRVMSEATAFMITYCLQTAVTDGLSSGAAINGINVAAKTGTTNFTTEIAKKYNLPSYAVNDAWIVGYDPDTAVAMWYGYDEIYNGSTGYYLKSASSGYKVNVLTERNRLYQTAGKVLFSSNGKDFKVPNSVVKVGVEKGTNPAKLASSATPKNKITYEYFVKGTEPDEVSTTYNKLKNVTNLTAKYDISTGNVILSWSAAPQGTDYDEAFGNFGYKIYHDNKYIDFTQDTNYTIFNSTNPTGTYKVITTYENYSDTDSSGVTAKISAQQTTTSVYTADINLPTTTYQIGQDINACLINGTVDNSCVTLYKDDSVVTNGYSVTVTIKDSSGNTTTIDTSTQNSYTATFKIEYDGSNRVTKSIAITVN